MKSMSKGEIADELATKFEMKQKKKRACKDYAHNATGMELHMSVQGIGFFPKNTWCQTPLCRPPRQKMGHIYELTYIYIYVCVCMYVYV